MGEETVTILFAGQWICESVKKVRLRNAQKEKPKPNGKKLTKIEDFEKDKRWWFWVKIE